MINHDAITHLEKYFKLSRTRFSEGDYALAAFFAITTIEETAKLLILRDTDLPQGNKKRIIRETFSHKSKYFSAMVNLISQSPQYERLPEHWQGEIDSWWDTDQLLKLRNDSLYMKFNKSEKLITPKKVISVERAALLVYVAGIALAELEEYISGFPSGWKESTLRVVKQFLKRYLK